MINLIRFFDYVTPDIVVNKKPMIVLMQGDSWLSDEKVLHLYTANSIG